MIALFVPVLNVMWLRLHEVYLCFPLGLQLWSRRLFSFRAFLGAAALEALRRWWYCVVISGHRLFESKILHQGNHSLDFVYNGSSVSGILSRRSLNWAQVIGPFSTRLLWGLSAIGALRIGWWLRVGPDHGCLILGFCVKGDWLWTEVWLRHWPRGQRWFISLMKEAGYPILYHFNLILGVSSYLAPDVIHKTQESSWFSNVLELGGLLSRLRVSRNQGSPIEPSGSVLNGSLVGRVEARAGMRVRAREISTVGAQESLLISWSSLSSVNSSLLEWGATGAVSTRRNESESAKATAIDQSSWDLFSRLIVLDALDRRMVNRRLGDSKGALQVPLSSIETARSSSFFTEGKRAPTRAPASTRSSYFNGWVVLKVFSSSSCERAGWPIRCGVFKIIKRPT